MCYYGRDEEVEGDGLLFEGVYAYSASPVIYEKRKIVITDKRVNTKMLNAIEKTYTLPGTYCSPDSLIESELKGIFSGVIFNKVKIYKVGNGNCVYSYGGTGRKRLLYDIGFDNNKAVKEDVSKTPYSYQPAINSIRKFEPSCIILSHWHEDHFKACAYGKDKIFECRWIAPDIKDAKANGKRLGVYLYLIDRMLFVDRTTSREIKIELSKYSRLTLYVGKNGGDLSKINCEGIAIKHENIFRKKHIRCLMQGDVSYKSLPVCANFSSENPYDYLIVPHHGSKMDDSLLSSTTIDGKAVICCTNDESKKRPEKNHRKKLEKCYNEVEMTENANHYIQFDLRKKNCMKKI